MYKVEKSDFEEFKTICEQSFEPGEPANCEQYQFDKLVHDGDIICIIGHINGFFDNDYKTYIVGAFTKLAIEHVRVLVYIGNKYLDCISVYPAEIIVEKNNRRFERFAEFFGFKKTLAQIAQNGIMYIKYIRNPECLLQQ